MPSVIIACVFLAQVIVPGFGPLSLYVLMFISLPLARQFLLPGTLTPVTLLVRNPCDCDNIHPTKPLTIIKDIFLIP